MADSVPGDHSPHDHFEREQSFDEAVSSNDPAAQDLTTDDLEAAYLRALEAMESEDWAVGPDSTDPESDPDELPADTPAAPFVSPDQTAAHETTSIDQTPPAGVSNIESPISELRSQTLDFTRSRGDSASGDVEIAGADFLGGQATVNRTDRGHPSQVNPQGPHSTRFATPEQPGTEPLVGGATRATDAAQPPPNATRIIESCLFVGGQPLSAKRLATLLESTGDASFIEQLVDDLNLEYAAQQRPYEIRLGDGGYRMALRTEFEAVRNRVYGVGPRDVKLSQDVLEVLALVAFQQPIAHAAVEACGKPNVANILRQLLRRELITLTRVNPARNGVEYRTSPRFLQVFGLGNLNELPRPEDLAIR